MIKLKDLIREDITIPVKVGDTILTGRFKNKKTIVKSIGKDEHGMPTINGRKVVNFRILTNDKNEQITEVILGERSPFKLNKGFTFKAKNSFDKIKKGIEYTVVDIIGKIGDLFVVVSPKNSTQTVKIPVRSQEEFYRNTMFEQAYTGNLGFEEMMKFYDIAPPKVIKKVEDLINRGRDKEAWKIIQKVTGVKLKGNQF